MADHWSLQHAGNLCQRGLASYTVLQLNGHAVTSAWQLQVEAFEEVERAFVHVDYLKRDEPEHKVDYNMFHHR